MTYFSTTAGVLTGAHRVLRTRGELTRFAREFAGGDPAAARAIAASGSATDFTVKVLVGWTATTGCSPATSAELRTVGSRLELHLSQPKPPPECFAADHLAVVFEVPRERLPARPEFG